MPPINETNVEQVQQDYVSILEGLLEGGMAYGEAKEKAQVESLLLHEEVESHWGTVPFNQLTLRKVISFRNLCLLPTVVDKGGWDNLTIKGKRELLWELGLDSTRLGWKTRIGYHRDLGDNLVFDKYVMSGERGDEEWINMVVDGKRVASFEAQLEASGDKSLVEEVGRLGR